MLTNLLYFTWVVLYNLVSVGSIYNQFYCNGSCIIRSNIIQENSNEYVLNYVLKDAWKSQDEVSSLGVILQCKNKISDPVLFVRYRKD